MVCTECGATNAEGKKFCTNCGKPMKAAKTRAQKAAPATTAKETAAAKSAATAVAEPPKPTAPKPAQAAPVNAVNPGPPQGSPYAVMSTGAYVLASILMSIPIIGWIIGIIWACGGCKNLNRRNYARAFLIFLLIGLVLSLVAYLLAGWAMSKVQGFLPGVGLGTPGLFGTSDASGTSGGLQDIFGVLRQLGDLVPSE